MHVCDDCDKAAIWRIFTDQWVHCEGGHWRNHENLSAHVCQEHLIARLQHNAAFHFVHRLDAAFAPDGIHFASLVERCHEYNLKFYERESFK